MSVYTCDRYENEERTNEQQRLHLTIGIVVMWSCIRIGSAACAKIVHVSPAIVAAYLSLHPLPTNCDTMSCHWVIPPSEWQPGGMFYPGPVTGRGNYAEPGLAWGSGALGLGGNWSSGWPTNTVGHGDKRTKETIDECREYDSGDGIRGHLVSGCVVYPPAQPNERPTPRDILDGPNPTPPVVSPPTPPLVLTPPQVVVEVDAPSNSGVLLAIALVMLLVVLRIGKKS